MSTCADVGSFIESKTSVVQTLNVGFTSEVSDYLVVHTGPGAYSYEVRANISWPYDSVLKLGEIVSVIYSVCLSAAAR